MDWHRRYVQQAAWTRQLRAYLFARAGLADSRRVLEVGCGTGAVLRDIHPKISDDPFTRIRAQPMVFGIDIVSGRLKECRVNVPSAQLAQADALALPFPDFSFDIVFCHYLLLWVQDPLAALLEMKRAVAQGGHVLALAEPDYAQRDDSPPPLEAAGRLQSRSLELQGADTSIGSHLSELFGNAGIRIVETGTILPVQRTSADDQEALDEWLVLESDLARVISPVEVGRIRELDLKARRFGQRRTYVPTFFAWGQV